MAAAPLARCRGAAKPRRTRAWPRTVPPRHSLAACVSTTWEARARESVWCAPGRVALALRVRDATCTRAFRRKDKAPKAVCIHVAPHRFRDAYPRLNGTPTGVFAEPRAERGLRTFCGAPRGAGAPHFYYR